MKFAWPWEQYLELELLYRGQLSPAEDIVVACARINPGKLKPPKDHEVSRHFEIVIDTSISMLGRKLADAKTAAKRVVDLLPADAWFAIAAFSTTAYHVHPMPGATVQANDLEKYLAHRAIDALEAKGNTNFFAGLALAHQQAFGAPVLERHGIFCSDGENNTQEREFADFMDAMREERRRGIYFQVSPFRFGHGRANERVGYLRQLSDVSGGDGVRVILDSSELEAAAANCLTGIRKKVLSNLRLFLRLAPGAELLDLKQVAPTIAPLKDLILPGPDGRYIAHMGAWGRESQLEFLIKIRAPKGAFDPEGYKLAGISLQFNHRGEEFQLPETGEGLPIRVTWTKDDFEATDLYDEPDVLRAQDAVDFSDSIDAGLDALSEEEFDEAERSFGRAAQLAHKYDDQASLGELRSVCEVIDPAKRIGRVFAATRRAMRPCP